MYLFAVHIADGVLGGSWLVAGFILAAILAWIGSRGLRDEEIPRIALLTAAFFVASSVHVRIPPSSSVHLLLNGLVGVLLGWRSALAIPVGLLLQAALFGHGGFATLGVNCCIMVLPALLTRLVFLFLHRLPWMRQRWFRDILVGGSTLLWCGSLVFSCALLAFGSPLESSLKNLAIRFSGMTPWSLPESGTAAEWAAYMTFHPIVLAGCAVIAGLAIRLEHRDLNPPEFPLGLLLGQLCVLSTTCLESLVLVWGGDESLTTLAKLVFVVHLPIAVLEGIVLGFTLGFLARVRPDMLGLPAMQQQIQNPNESAPR